MKRLVLTIVLVASFNLVFATVRTVCNMVYSPGQFTAFAAALTASSPGDTIYVLGSSISYGSININKNNITVIGAGFNPLKTVPMPSLFTSISLSGSNCQLIGLTFDVLICSSASNATTVKRCRLQTSNSTTGIIMGGSGGGNDWLIEGNIFVGTSFPSIDFGFGTTNNTIVRNNIFNSQIGDNTNATSPSTFLVFNNLFLSGVNPAFFSLFQANISNNIFYQSSPQGSSTGCVMNNNISFNCPNNNFPAPGTNNLVNINPLFTNFPLSGAYFNYAHDYHLDAGSPGVLTGSDGTDRGIYGGFGTRFTMTGEPALAEVTDVTITSPTTIPPGGTLTISVTSKRVK